MANADNDLGHEEQKSLKKNLVWRFSCCKSTEIIDVILVRLPWCLIGIPPIYRQFI